MERRGNGGAIALQQEQILAEIIDEAVEGLVRNRLLVMAGAAQDQRLVADGAQEGVDELGLPDPGGAFDANQRRPIALSALEALVQLLQLGSAAGEGCALHAASLLQRYRHRGTGGLGRSVDLVSPGATFGLGVEQGADERLQILGNRRRQRAERGQLEPLQARPDIVEGAAERHLSGERFEQQNADAVPVRRGSQRPCVDLLRRHVLRCPG